ncbi:hypothetical protein CVT24_008799 [Panaeolus cyanescens]|uniref:Ubiquitin 3 binding protein But2 C-terminal domain-containing protein n=1 Tax=Panaeolus cyanescens TaxID=181874 RepID=A0A409VB45_9AGAR|nr:hypothetical protein CVT24_008799 [Panaeolus cyanescens]
MAFLFAGKNHHKLIPNSEESTDRLLSHEEEESAPASCHSCGQSSNPKTTSLRGDALTSWALVICLLCTIANSLLFLDPTGGCGPKTSMDCLLTFNRKDYSSLKRPSPFIGLDKIARPEVPTPRTLINYPQQIMQIDAAQPDFVFDDDPRRYMTRNGIVSPEDRLVKVSKYISTIVEFRAIDFGMENCELKLRIPANATAREHGAPLEHFFIGVYRLDTNKPLDTKALSYNTAPRRLTNVANIEVSPGKPIDYHANFHCPWDTILTFELSCFGEERKELSGGPCSIQWWQNKESANLEIGQYRFL